MTKQRDKIAQYKRFLEHLLIRSKTMRQSYCQYLSLLITMPKMPIPVISHSNSIVATILKSYSKKMLTPTQNLALLTN